MLRIHSIHYLNFPHPTKNYFEVIKSGNHNEHQVHNVHEWDSFIEVHRSQLVIWKSTKPNFIIHWLLLKYNRKQKHSQLYIVVNCWSTIHQKNLLQILQINSISIPAEELSSKQKQLLFQLTSHRSYLVDIELMNHEIRLQLINQHPRRGKFIVAENVEV